MPVGHARRIQVKFWMNDTEAAKFQSNFEASGAPFKSDYFRAVSLGPTWAARLPAWRELVQIRAELRRQGTNINQIARVLNKLHREGRLDGDTWDSVERRLNPIFEANDALAEQLKDQIDRLKR